MALRKPLPGQVIRYSYLWHHEFRKGQEEGRKDRPCAVILSSTDLNDKTFLTVVPVTHTPPENPNHAVKIPNQIKQHLGLDDERSWIIVDEVNYFEWPGPDIRPIPNSNPPRIDYGRLPPTLFESVKRTLKLAFTSGRLQKIKRTK